MYTDIWVCMYVRERKSGEREREREVDEVYKKGNWECKRGRQILKINHFIHLLYVIFYQIVCTLIWNFYK